MRNNKARGEPITVLIAGIGSASLGLEIFKSLKYAGNYKLFGTDKSKNAYGLTEQGFEKTYILEHTKDEKYARQILDICFKNNITAVAPGAGATHSILSANREIFKKNDILLMVNSKAVVDLCSDKLKCMMYLKKKCIPVPETREIINNKDVKNFKYFPCVVKPMTNSGGSNLVFLAENEKEALFFIKYLEKRGYRALIEEYIVSTDEFTVGILSLPSGKILGSIALKRSLEQKLSYIMKYDDRIISSGWSQGEINEFKEVRAQAEKIAKVLGSKWALNIQGRFKKGIFYPFEINPRHSGTTYLRALAGFNEPDILLKSSLKGIKPSILPLKKGYYLRSFVEKYIPIKSEKSYG